ncbi:MAG: transposase [Nitrospira sp.]|nr:transposase [Nitrospira sp.]
MDAIGAKLSGSPVLHADETGVRCMGKTHWLHVVSNEELTLYSHSPRRGLEGIRVAGVLPEYSGQLMHDFWGAYDKLEHCEHLRCNAHLLRELKACAEDKHRWATELSDILVEMKQARDQALRDDKDRVAGKRRRELEARYDEWITQGLAKHPVKPKSSGRRGRAKQSREHNLLKRMESKKAEILGFLHEIRLPLTTTSPSETYG